MGYFIKGISDHAHKELTPHEILVAFQHEYQNKDVPIALQDISTATSGATVLPPSTDATLAIPQRDCTTSSARGNGPLDAVSNAV